MAHILWVTFGLYLRFDDFKANLYLQAQVSKDYTVRHLYHYNFELSIIASNVLQNQTNLVSRGTLGCKLSTNAQIFNISATIILTASLMFQRSENVTFFDLPPIHF